MLIEKKKKKSVVITQRIWGYNELFPKSFFSLRLQI